MPPDRSFAPTGSITYYRITAPLPLIVIFPSVAYTVQLESVLSAGRHELAAHDARRAVWPRIGPCYRSLELLREAVFVSGVPVRADTIGAVIFRRLVEEGRAVRVPTPADDPADRWPPLGERGNAGQTVARLRMRGFSSAHMIQVVAPLHVACVDKKAAP